MNTPQLLPIALATLRTNFLGPPAVWCGLGLHRGARAWGCAALNSNGWRAGAGAGGTDTGTDARTGTDRAALGRTGRRGVIRHMVRLLLGIIAIPGEACRHAVLIDNAGGVEFQLSMYE